MIIKKFIGKTESEATEAAKKELGETLVIMNVKKVNAKGPFAFLKKKMVEVTAALEDEEEPLRQIRKIAQVQEAAMQAAKLSNEKNAGKGLDLMTKSGEGTEDPSIKAAAIVAAAGERTGLHVDLRAGDDGAQVGAGSNMNSGNVQGPNMNSGNAQGSNLNTGNTHGPGMKTSAGAVTGANGTYGTDETHGGDRSYEAGEDTTDSYADAYTMGNGAAGGTGAVSNVGTGSFSHTDGEGRDPKEAELDRFIRLLYNTMLDNEVDELLANEIIQDAEKNRKPGATMDFILATIYQKMILKFGKSTGIEPAAEGPRIVFFIGPTGVGKTTTIAKVASSFSVTEKKKVALLTMDTYRIAATDQLRTYASILEVPFRVIYTVEDMLGAVDDFLDCDYIFVDTAGHNHKDEALLEKQKDYLNILKEQHEIQSFLVVSATTKYRDLKAIVDNYREVADFQLIFTKLDETGSLGNLFNLKIYADAPIAYVTAGQNVPDDIEVFNAQKNVKQLLGGK